MWSLGGVSFIIINYWARGSTDLGARAGTLVTGTCNRCFQYLYQYQWLIYYLYIHICGSIVTYVTLDYIGIALQVYVNGIVTDIIVTCIYCLMEQ